MKLVAIVTVDRDEAGASEFRRLLDTGRSEIDFWVVVCRDETGETESIVEALFRHLNLATSSQIVTTAPCGVSAARNAGLRAYEAQTSKDPRDILSFPDDDCSYPHGFGMSVKQAFSSMASQVLIIPYGPSPGAIDRRRWPQESIPDATASQLLKLVSSAGIFITSSCIADIGNFEVSLGVGTPREAAEDLELILRAKYLGFRVAYTGAVSVQHEYREPTSGRLIGNLCVIHKYRGLISVNRYVRAWARALKYWIRRARFREALHTLRSVSDFDRVKDTVTEGRKRDVGGLHISAEAPNVLVERAAHQLVNGTQPLTVVAAHITALNSARDPAFRAAFNSADLSMVDGISLSVVSALTPGPRLQKLATTDFAPQVLRRATEVMRRPVRAALVGGHADVVARAAANLSANSSVEVVYQTHGYWNDYSPVIVDLERIRPDVLILGLGMPLEAFWLVNNRHKLSVPLVITCGGWLRILAGDEDRAPTTLQRAHLEWAWRLLTDHRRTTRRYITGVSSVVVAILNGWAR